MTNRLICEQVDTWIDRVASLEENNEVLHQVRICLGAVSTHRELLDWIEGTPEFDGHALELHPNVVDQENLISEW